MPGAILIAEIELEVTTTTNPIHFAADGVDILIQYGQRPAEVAESPATQRH